MTRKQKRIIECWDMHVDMESDIMSIAERRQIDAMVESDLGGKVICDRCHATLDDIADVCTADLADACPGFIAIETAKQNARRVLETKT